MINFCSISVYYQLFEIEFAIIVIIITIIIIIIIHYQVPAKEELNTCLLYILKEATLRKLCSSCFKIMQ